MRNIAVLTGTRAEYGLLKNTLIAIDGDVSLNLQLVVTGSHLAQKYGYTVDEISRDGFEIFEKIVILDDENSSVVDSMTKEMAILSDVFERLEPDILLLLGDRYEIFIGATVAMMKSIPIAHISGGEVTEGAVDDQIRHAITKMSHIHFPGAEKYAHNILRMGEEAWRIYNVGDPAIENIKKNNFLSLKEIEERINVKIDKELLLVTYHPVTLELEKLKTQVNSLLSALEVLECKIIITYPNADEGSDYIIKMIEEFSKTRDNVYVYKSLGIQMYLSVMKYCGAVVGNSSSAVIEAPFLKVPAVNIGNRQKGRLMAKNIISCSNSKEDILVAINRVLDTEFKEIAKNAESIYGEGNTSKEIVEVLKMIPLGEKLLKKKLIWS